MLLGRQGWPARKLGFTNTPTAAKVGGSGGKCRIRGIFLSFPTQLLQRYTWTRW
jgi:hypothetical protein